MRITIIIPVYNVRRYLPQCLDSILAQSRNADEIILVDDGSVDGSADICDEYARKFAAIQVIHQSNKGVSAARNAGLEQSSGDYVAFLDADDVIAPDYISTYCSKIQTMGCDTCKGTYRRMKQTGQLLPVYHITQGTYRKECIINMLIPRLIGSAPDKKDSIPMGVWATFYDAGIIREYHLKFPPEQMLYSEDMAFNLLYLMHAKYVEVMDYAGYYYRITEGSSTKQFVADRFERYMCMYQWEKEQIKKLGIYESCRYRLTRQLFNQMRNVFHQYKRSVCGLSFRDAGMELYRICSEGELQELIAAYPVNQMGIKQQVFVYMIKLRLVWLIYLFYCL